MKKKTNKHILRSDEMLDCLGNNQIIPRVDMKMDFHQIRVKHEDIEKLLFHENGNQFKYFVIQMDSLMQLYRFNVR